MVKMSARRGARMNQRRGAVGNAFSRGIFRDVDKFGGKSQPRSSSSSSKGSSQSRITKTLAWIALALNVLILPGLGSLIALRIKSGVAQIIIYVIGMVLLGLGVW